MPKCSGKKVVSYPSTIRVSFQTVLLLFAILQSEGIVWSPTSPFNHKQTVALIGFLVTHLSLVWSVTDLKNARAAQQPARRQLQHNEGSCSIMITLCFKAGVKPGPTASSLQLLCTAPVVQASVQMNFIVTSQSFLYDVMLVLCIFHSLNRLQSHQGGTEFYSSCSWIIILLIGRRNTTLVWTEKRCWGSAAWPFSQQKWFSPACPGRSRPVTLAASLSLGSMLSMRAAGLPRPSARQFLPTLLATILAALPWSHNSALWTSISTRSGDKGRSSWRWGSCSFSPCIESLHWTMNFPQRNYVKLELYKETL